MLQAYCLHSCSFAVNLRGGCYSSAPKRSQAVEPCSERAPGPEGSSVLLFGVALVLQPACAE